MYVCVDQILSGSGFLNNGRLKSIPGSYSYID